MQFDQLKRRDFITLLGGAAAAWPRVARAQQGERMRRIGVLMGPGGGRRGSAGPRRGVRAGPAAIGLERRPQRADRQALGGGRCRRTRRYAAELIALAPDVILAPGSFTIGPLLQVSRSVPIVFVHVPDPVGAGFVDSLARPGGNATGFILFEYATSAKWLELLKQIAPGLTRVAVIRDPALTSGTGQFAAIQALAPSLGVEVTPVNVRDAGEIERAITAFARSPNGGLILTGSALSQVHRQTIVALAARHKLPAIYYERFVVAEGGLMSYGPSLVDQFQRAAGYADRILKGEKPADLPVQTPTKYELAINLKTAKALGLEVPPTLLVRADEVIE